MIGNEIIIIPKPHISRQPMCLRHGKTTEGHIDRATRADRDRATKADRVTRTDIRDSTKLEEIVSLQFMRKNDRPLQLTNSATLKAISKRVGKSSFEMRLLTDGESGAGSAFERLRQTRYLGGLSGPCSLTATMRGETRIGPQRMRSTSP